MHEMNVLKIVRSIIYVDETDTVKIRAMDNGSVFASFGGVEHYVTNVSRGRTSELEMRFLALDSIDYWSTGDHTRRDVGGSTDNIPWVNIVSRDSTKTKQIENRDRVN